MSVKNLKEIIDAIDIPIDDDVVYWNTDDNKDDLENWDGDTYSAEIIGAPTEYDGYYVVNANTGCGETVTYLFNLEKEIEG